MVKCGEGKQVRGKVGLESVSERDDDDVRRGTRSTGVVSMEHAGIG